MSGIASKGQLQMAFVRVAIVIVPLIVFLGFLVGVLSNSGNENRWYMALQRPAIQPPDWAFGATWTVLYILMGLSLAMIIHARGAPGRWRAIWLFVAQLVVNFFWSPLFFAAHQVTLAIGVLLLMLGLAVMTTYAFAKIRQTAAWLLLPYLIWLGFATALTYETHRLNPDAETLVPGAQQTHILL